MRPNDELIWTWLAAGSVVRTSVFVRQSFPAPCPIYGWQMTTLWVNCPLWASQPGQLSLLSLLDR